MSKKPANHLEVFKGGDGWYFHRKNRNGKITSPSEGYTRRSSAIRAAKRLFPLDAVVFVEHPL